MTRPGREQALLVFFSVDLSSGTDYKVRHPVSLAGSTAEDWPKRFERFFLEFQQQFQASIKRRRAEHAESQALLSLPKLWKVNGDELLFVDLVYPNESAHRSLVTSVASFVETVRNNDARLLPEGLGVKGCVWTAGFPVRNRELRILHVPALPLLKVDGPQRDADTGRLFHAEGNLVVDYVGPEIDLGFRLGGITPPSRISCSLDLAYLLATEAPEDELAIYHVGWRRLKGVAGGHPYPVIWLEPDTHPTDRHPWDLSIQETTDETRALLQPNGGALLRSAEVKKLAGRIWEQIPSYLMGPYSSPNQMASVHKLIWAERGSNGLPALTVNQPGSAHGAPVEHEVLNQLQILLRERPELLKDLRVVLRRIVDHPEYDKWSKDQQYAGEPFTLPSDLIEEDDKRRRLLEQLQLVWNNELRVKITHCDGDMLFMTDGLWVPSAVRTFAFNDESDHLLSRCRELGWMEWASSVIDPATGCGHNALRYPGPTVRRFGYDINFRALTFAAINALLNDVPIAMLGINDVRTGVSLSVEEGNESRVLFLVNMPFALVPDASVQSTATTGGRYGYELTLAALKAIADFRRAGEKRGIEVRGLVLTYSVGSKARNKWVVEDEARQLFGSEIARWRILRDEPLWRVNGKKEEDNPMPIEHIVRRAEDKFYVRSDANRDKVRAEYEQLIGELRRSGWDNLAYGMIEIDPARN